MFAADLRVQTEATVAVAHLIGTISRPEALRISGTLAETSDRFLLAFTAIYADNLAPEKRGKLFQFLCERAEIDHPSASLAVIILIIGIDVWGSQVIARIMKLLITKSFLPLVTQLFNAFASTEFGLVVEGAKFLIMESRDKEIVRRVFEIITVVSVQHESLIGARGTRAIAMIAAQVPGIGEIAESCLAVHAEMFRNVAKFDKILLIGDEEGTISVFRRGKLVLQKQLFVCPITMISIDPNGKVAVAMAAQSRELKKFDIPTNGHFCEPVVLPNVMDCWDNGITIGWEGSKVVLHRRSTML
jgi:hypothetical protein